jgi:hypothetical protein
VHAPKGVEETTVKNDTNEIQSRNRIPLGICVPIKIIIKSLKVI